ncbi:MFS transporter [Lactobacillus delbrueckii]|uniref:MFS transporter n=1 Tax=Lactobacillus delbrueckii TaxID=1584 RepID=UPI0011CAC79C|nr:MFS transporter [Lactobacillus delbrueckii]TXG03805.1 multidrug efflux MFS transporter [Lactobacillus delbrueckii subsp. bulgaricus]
MSSKIPKKVYAAILATGLMSFSGVLVETAMNVAFPTLMKQFGLATNTVQWITSIYLLVISVIVPLSAVLKRSFKTKQLFVTANLLFFAGLLLDALAPNFAILLLGRAIQGLGTGIALPLMFNIILEQVAADKIGLMMGFGNLITGVSPALGPTFGGFVINNLGWRYVFFLMPLIILSLFLGLYGIQQKSKIVKIKPDFLSIVFIAVLFAGVIYGFSNLSSGKLLTNLFPIFIGLCSLGNAFLLPNYVQLLNQSTATIAGLVTMPAGIVGAMMSVVGGRLYDDKGARFPIIIITGASLMAAELIAFVCLFQQMSDLVISLVYIIYMTGMGMSIGAIMTNALASFKPEFSAQGNALLNTIQQFAGAIGTSLTSAIVALSQAQYGSKGPRPTAIGTQHAFIFPAVIVVFLWLMFYKNVKIEGGSK